ncbi:cpna-5 [Pristionchus pacificus]|uniref:Cpna-5 n=1 Tax=Pristionchus pacificus TaxID=54126 RepID=A0A2A6B3V7_PRIPA|nr:cpna-5 [Pristionchus pacificus]|eukprot:PDM60554.1 cpna-5 [Pristionchus pacificus]
MSFYLTFSSIARMAYDPIDITLSIRDFNPPSLPSRMIVCVVYENDTDREENWRCIGMSIPCPIQSSIFFNEAFTYNFIFERTQLIKVNICPYLHVNKEQYGESDKISTAIFKVDELIGSFGLQLRKPLLVDCSISAIVQLGLPKQPSFSSLGSLLVDATLPQKKQPIVIQFEGKGLERKELIWDETAVFFRVYRMEQGSEEDVKLLLYESEAIKVKGHIQNHSHPVWMEFSLEVQDVADDRNRLLSIEVLYRDVDGSEGWIGKCLTTYAKMKYGAGKDNIYKVVNDTKKSTKRSYDNSGFIELTKFTDVSFYSFLDYIVSGTQLHYEIAVDFSEQRGAKSDNAERNRDETLLQMGIRGLGCVLRDYTPNRLFPAFGFGARLPPLAEESDEFNLNFTCDPVCRGLDGVVEAFKKANSIMAPMDTPRCAKIISALMRHSQESGKIGLHYHVAAIFTRGGPIEDWKESLAALCSAALHPISIIFVGVGVGDFTSYSKLVRKAREAQKETRICVEAKLTTKLNVFIELHKIVDLTQSLPANRARIAEHGLTSLPSQMVSFMHRNAVSAKPPIQICRSPLFHSSSLIPDRPTQFAFDDETAIIGSILERGRNGSVSGQVTARVQSPYTQHKSGRRGSEGQFLNVNPDSLREQLGLLSARLPERSRSVLNTSREQFMIRHAVRQREREERNASERMMNL